MALFKIHKGTEKNNDGTSKLPQSYVEGYAYFATDTGRFYIDTTNQASGRKMINPDAITNITRNGTTFTATKVDGSTITFTQQDNNTTYTFAPGSADGTIAVNGTDIYVQGLKESALDPLYSKYVLHDIFAFCRAATPTYEASTNGSTWTTLTLDKKIFDQKDSTESYMFQDGYNAHRWTWDSTVFSYSSIRYLLVKYSYTADQPRSRLIMEAKPDSSWITIVDTEYSANSSWKTIPVNGYSTGPIRITIQKADFTTEGTIPLVALQCFSIRPGNQGQHIEYESPIDWDENRNITGISFSGSGAGLTSLNASNISSGTIAAARLPAATSSALGGVKIGSNITVSSGTISLTKANVIAALGYTPPTSDTNTTYTFSTGDSNGQIKVVASTGSSANVAVKGLGSNAYTSTAYLPLAGGTMTGTLYLQTTTTIADNKPAQLIFKTIQSDNSITTQSGFIKFYDDHDAAANGGSMVIQSAGNMIIGSGESPNACYTTDLVGNTSENMYITSDSNIYFYTNCQTYSSKKSTVYINTSGALYGAVWNDYAEYRSQNETIEPGYITYCDDDGKLKLTTERLQKFEGVVSDTFGFAIGETDNCKTPLAVSGRVLVYCDPEEEHFHSGDCVCAGPDGLAYRMTREEIVAFPDRIVGIVSEIPTYETWGTGNIKVNGRIWVKVR